MGSHDIAKSPDSQTNKSSKRDNMTPEFCKNIKRPISTTSDLASQETRKYKKNLKLGGERCYCPVSFPEIIFGNTRQKLLRADVGLEMLIIPEKNHLLHVREEITFKNI